MITEKFSNGGQTPKKVIYIGPSFEGLSAFTVFVRGQYPAPVVDLMAKYPNIKGLMVPVERLQQARKDVVTPGNILNHYMKHVKDEQK